MLYRDSRLKGGGGTKSRQATNSVGSYARVTSGNVNSQESPIHNPGVELQAFEKRALSKTTSDNGQSVNLCCYRSWNGGTIEVK